MESPNDTAAGRTMAPLSEYRPNRAHLKMSRHRHSPGALATARGPPPELTEAFLRLCDKVEVLTNTVRDVHADMEVLKAQYAVLAAAAQGAGHGVQMTVTFTPPPLRSTTTTPPLLHTNVPHLPSATSILPPVLPPSTTISSTPPSPLPTSSRSTQPPISVDPRVSPRPKPEQPPAKRPAKRQRRVTVDVASDSDDGINNELTDQKTRKLSAGGWREIGDDDACEVKVVPSSTPTTPTISSPSAHSPSRRKSRYEPIRAAASSPTAHNKRDKIFVFTDHLNSSGDGKANGNDNRKPNEKKKQAKDIESEREKTEEELKEELEEEEEEEEEVASELAGELPSDSEMEAEYDNEPRHDQPIEWLGTDVVPQGKPVNHRSMPDKVTKLEQLRDFWQRIKFEFEVKPDTGCWLCTCPRDSANAYIRKSLAGKKFFAHALSYVTWNRRIDVNLPVVQLCGERLCLNPKHLNQAADGPADTEERRQCLEQRSAATCPFTPRCVGHKRGVSASLPTPTSLFTCRE